MLIELEAPDVDTEMKAESLVDSGVRGCGMRKGDELILGRRRAESSPSIGRFGFWHWSGTLVWCRADAVLREQRCIVGAGVQYPHYFQVVGTPMATGDFILLFFFLKVLCSFSGQSDCQAHWQSRLYLFGIHTMPSTGLKVWVLF